MAVITYAQATDLMLDALQANVATDPAFAAAEILRHYNDAYQIVWEMYGGKLKKATSAAAWGTAAGGTADATGVLSGVLTDIEEVLHVFSSLTQASTGAVAGEDNLDRVEYAELLWWRANTAGMGTYATPKKYSIIDLATTTDANVNKVQMDVWPGVGSRHFPIHYVPQFTPLDGSSITTPDVNDILSRDIPYIAAIFMAPLEGRAELAEALALKISERGQKALERKLTARAEGKQDE